MSKRDMEKLDRATWEEMVAIKEAYPSKVRTVFINRKNVVAFDARNNSLEIKENIGGLVAGTYDLKYLPKKPPGEE